MKKYYFYYGVNVNKNPLKISIEDMSNIEDVKNRFQSTIPKGKEINIDEDYRSEDVDGKPTFQIDESNHSNALDAVKHSTINRGTPKQWMDNLKMVGDENIVEDLKFLGMNNFLESAERLYADDLIPKEALEDYITLNKTKVDQK